jgi:hypothetical protein
VVDFSVLCLDLSVEIFLMILRSGSVQIRGSEAPELSNPHSGNDATAGVPLKCFGLNADESSRLLTVQQPLRNLRRMGGIEHGSHTP